MPGPGKWHRGGGPFIEVARGEAAALPPTGHNLRGLGGCCTYKDLKGPTGHPGIVSLHDGRQMLTGWGLLGEGEAEDGTGEGGRAGVDAHSQQEAVKEARPPCPSPSPTGHLQGAEAQGGQVPAQEWDGCPISPSAPCRALSSAFSGRSSLSRHPSPTRWVQRCGVHR